MKKQYLKTKPVCKVTFRLQKEVAQAAKTVNIVGDFNNWDIYATPMKKLKNGVFTATLDLGVDTEYQFRYLIDETKWENDGHADKYVPTPYGNAENSVVVV
jgi:1,4-alpha-glucan branching enzyme